MLNGKPHLFRALRFCLGFLDTEMHPMYLDNVEMPHCGNIYISYVSCDVLETH